MSENSKNAIKKVSSRVLICPWAKKTNEKFYKGQVCKKLQIGNRNIENSFKINKAKFQPQRNKFSGT